MRVIGIMGRFVCVVGLEGLACFAVVKFSFWLDGYLNPNRASLTTTFVTTINWAVFSALFLGAASAGMLNRFWNKYQFALVSLLHVAGWITFMIWLLPEGYNGFSIGMSGFAMTESGLVLGIWLRSRFERWRTRVPISL